MGDRKSNSGISKPSFMLQWIKQTLKLNGYYCSLSKPKVVSQIEPEHTRTFWDWRDKLVQSWNYKMRELRPREVRKLFKIKQLTSNKTKTN